MDKILSIMRGIYMKQFVWETAEEIDQKLAKRIRNIRKRRSISQEKLFHIYASHYR